jgi:multiple sugar transport system permease protein
VTKQKNEAGRNLSPLQAGLLYLLLLLGSVPILIPFFWMLSTSLKPRELAGEYPPQWIPQQESHFLVQGTQRTPVTLLLKKEDGTARIKTAEGKTANVLATQVTTERKFALHWENYGRIVGKKAEGSDDDFLRYLFNTLLVAGMSVTGQVLTSSLVGWGFARLRFAGKKPLFFLMLATMMIPGQISMIPVFMIFRWLGWIDTFLPLIVPAWFGSAFFAFLYRQFFMGIPTEMDEAATVDGCTPLTTFWHILLPMARPVTATVAVYTFLGAWNDFLSPLIYLNSDYKRTLSLALAKFQGAYSTDVPVLMAAATLMLIPVLCLYFFSQKALMQGMVVSGIKG